MQRMMRCLCGWWLVPWLVLWLGCGAPTASLADGRAYADALAVRQRDSEAAAQRCTQVEHAGIRADCFTALAEDLAAKGLVEAALRRCDSVPGGAGRDECIFQVAEKAKDPNLCTGAGGFADDCAMHLWSQGGFSQIPPALEGAELEAQVALRAEQAGFKPDDERPWIAFFRDRLSKQTPLDLSTCARFSRNYLCRSAGLGYYNDLLNHARDSGSYPCEREEKNGEELPPRLQHMPDPEVSALREARRGELCPMSPG